MLKAVYYIKKKKITKALEIEEEYLSDEEAERLEKILRGEMVD